METIVILTALFVMDFIAGIVFGASGIVLYMVFATKQKMRENQKQKEREK